MRHKKPASYARHAHQWESKIIAESPNGEIVKFLYKAEVWGVTTKGKDVARRWRSRPKNTIEIWLKQGFGVSDHHKRAANYKPI